METEIKIPARDCNGDLINVGYEVMSVRTGYSFEVISVSNNGMIFIDGILGLDFEVNPTDYQLI